MLNQVCLIGVVNRIECINKNYYLYLNVRRNFKDLDGNFKYDLIKCRIWKGVKEQVPLYAKEDQLICIQGRLEIQEDSNYEVVAYDTIYLR